MTALQNFSPLATLVELHTDMAGQPWQLVIAKGVWRLDSNTLADRPGVLAPQPSPLMVSARELQLDAAQRHVLGERLDQQLEWFPADAVPPKAAFDFLVCGYAHAPDGKPCARFRAGVAWEGSGANGKPEERQHLLDIHAPRYWKATVLQGSGAVPGAPLAPIVQAPLHPAFAYGGGAAADSPPFNPLGMGRITSSKHTDGLPLPMPWLEHGGLRSALTTRLSNPPPAALGPWPAHAGHRRPHGGTFDATWRKERWPLPPLDLDPRYYNQADPALQWPHAPAAGSLIHLFNLTRAGSDCIRWPALRPVLDCNANTIPLRADTCIVDTEERAYAIVWRALVPPGVSATLRVHPR